MAEHEQLEVTSVQEWSAWLEANHDRVDGVWLVTHKKAAGEHHVPYDDIVREALRFGWVDSKPRALDDGRSQLHVTRRNPRSNWSGANKRRIAELEAAGRMHPAGAAAVALAKRTGTWTALDAVERLEVPPDLDAAFAEHPPARAEWDAFPPSARRALLEWITSAKRPETRAKRVADTAEKAARGLRANEWRRR